MKIKNVGRTYLSKLGEDSDEGKNFSILLEKFPITPPKEGDSFYEHYFLRDKDITKISFREFIEWINWINGSLSSFKYRFLAMKIIQFHYQLLNTADYSSKNYFFEKIVEEEFEDASIEALDSNFSIIFGLFQMELNINKKTDTMVFGGQKEKIQLSDKLTITAGTNGKLNIKSNNQVSIGTDTADFDIFFNGPDGYIKRSEAYKWKHFNRGEDPVKKIIYDGFETVDHFFI